MGDGDGGGDGDDDAPHPNPILPSLHTSPRPFRGVPCGPQHASPPSPGYYSVRAHVFIFSFCIYTLSLAKLIASEKTKILCILKLY